METRILHLFTRTPLHVGAGASVGSVDQPVQRERHTGFPVVPGSSLKGVIRDHFEHALKDEEAVNEIFGYSKGDNNSRSGAISFSEARLLAFPLRSARGAFALATCPLALERYARDRGLDLPLPAEPGEQECLAGLTVTLSKGDKKAVVLEEYAFASQGEFPADWAECLSGALDDAVLHGARHRWVMLNNGDFAHFALNACQVHQHVRISSETGTAAKGGLFNEETVPSETLFYSLLTKLPFAAPTEKVFTALESEQLMQFGGNGTTGHGFCTVKLEAAKA